MSTTDTAERPAVPPEPTAGGRRGRVVLLAALGVLLLLAVVYLVLWAVAGDKVPRGASVEGVEVGGRSAADAEDTLREALADRETAPVAVVVGGEAADTEELTPDQLGLAVDYEASVDEVGGSRSLSPARLWDYYTGGADVDAVLTVDDDALDEQVAALDEQYGRPATEGGLAFADGEVQVTEAEEGRALEADVTREALMAAYLDTEPVAELALAPVVPDVDAGDVAQAREEFADPAVSAPVTLVVGDAEVVIEPTDYDFLSMAAQDGELVPQVDGEALSDRLDEAIPDAQLPTDATVELVDGSPQVIPGEQGVGFGPDKAAQAFEQGATGRGSARTVEVQTRQIAPDFTVKDARALGIKRQVSTFTTEFPYAEYRNINIGQAAENVDGTLLLPGETFSFNDIVGERTEENGFTTGFVISDGIFASDLGGGVSQMATTTYNAAFFAGLEDVEHKPHSFYIDRYPEGREATVVFGSLDLRFRNNTDYGILISATTVPSTPTSSGSVTVSMYSTPVWDIESETSERYNFTSPGTRTLTTPDCYPNAGYGGFDVDVTRIFKRPGESEVVKEETQQVTYTPSDTVVCEEPPPPPSDDGGGGNGGGNGGGSGGGGNGGNG
ncbi:VanW family protein [uncultured Nocardioides sp.]|uniref:VanW family protein n=1 Tax=uncultured Nocardioides sp. TaxID=198441 RepID=UPI002627D1AB|nr:VanW family protein [uncultured Nocardioides sp.]